MSADSAPYIAQARKVQRNVHLKGTAGLMLFAGMGLCYDRDYGVATDSEGRRDKIVQVPDATNHMWFAGVLDHDVTIPSTGEVRVDINEPGSICEIAIGGQSAVVDSTRFACSCSGPDAGRFTLAALGGRGTAVALQSATALAAFMDGGASYAYATKTLTKTGAFVGVTAGCRCVILGFDGGVTGVYTVASATDNTLVFATDIGGGSDRAKVTGYVVGTNETTILAMLLDGAESGLQEVVALKASTAFSLMIGGMSYLAPGTLTAADATTTVADGSYPGQRKVIQSLGANTTNDGVVTVTNHSTSSPEQLFFKAAGDVTVLDWFGTKWQQTANTASLST